MKTFLTWIVLVLFAALIWIGFTAVSNHLAMQEKLDPLEMQFEMVVMDHMKNRTPYAGRIDRLINVRNELLKNEKFLWAGTWSTGDDGLNAVYLKATWLPDELYRYAWATSHFGAKNFGDVIAMALIFIIPFLAYFGTLGLAVWLTIKLFGKVTKRYIPW